MFSAASAAVERRRGPAFAGLLLLISVVLMGPPAFSDTVSPSPSPSDGSPTSTVDPGSSSGGSGVTFGVQPAQRGGVDSRPFFSWAVTPGATLRDHVAIVNYSRKPLRLSVLATDAVNTSDGGFGLLDTSARPVDAGAWIRIRGASKPLTIPRRSGGSPGSVVLPVAVQVPAKASPGDHTAGILAVLTSLDPNNEGTKVKLEQRVGTRVFVRVAGDAEPSLAIENLSASYDGTANPVGRGTATVRYTLTNTGNLNLGAESSVDVSGLLSSSAVTVPDVPLLLVGNSIDVTAKVSDVLPQIWMNAEVSVTPIQAVGDTPQPLPVVSKSIHFWAIPWTLLLLLALLIVAIVGWRRWQAKQQRGRRRRGKRAAGRPGSESLPSHKIPEGVRS